MTPRTAAGGSKNQSIASVAQNATPSHATAARAALPAKRTGGCGGAARRSTACHGGGERPVDRSMFGGGHGHPFYASFTSRRISHSKQSKPHKAIIIQRSQVSSHCGFGAVGDESPCCVRSFSCCDQGVGPAGVDRAAGCRRNTCRRCSWRSRSAGRRCAADSPAPGRAPSPGCGG